MAAGDRACQHSGNAAATSVLHFQVDAHALLVSVPYPVSLQANSVYAQETMHVLHPTACGESRYGGLDLGRSRGVQ